MGKLNFIFLQKEFRNQYIASFIGNFVDFFLHILKFMNQEVLLIILEDPCESGYKEKFKNKSTMKNSLKFNDTNQSRFIKFLQIGTKTE